MVFESGNLTTAPGHLIGLGCRAEAHLATRQNKIEQRSYEVIALILTPFFIQRYFDFDDFQDAIAALNALQTNSVTITKSTHNIECKNVEETGRYLEKIGVTLDDLDKLSVIHVAGTKGKVDENF